MDDTISDHGTLNLIVAQMELLNWFFECIKAKIPNDKPWNEMKRILQEFLHNRAIASDYNMIFAHIAHI